MLAKGPVLSGCFFVRCGIDLSSSLDCERQGLACRNRAGVAGVNDPDAEREHVYGRAPDVFGRLCLQFLVCSEARQITDPIQPGIGVELERGFHSRRVI